MSPYKTALHDLNWNLLRLFCAIAEEESLTRAAKRLNMSQPSVSQALQRLEDQLGCQLVFRASRHFALTARGERIYQECAEILRCVDRISVMTGDKNKEEFGSLNLQIVSMLESALINEAIRLYHQRYPSVLWSIEVQNSQETVRRIKEEQAGIGICLLAKPVFNLNCQFLFREEFAVFCGAEHPFFGREQLSKRELRQEPFVAFTCATEGMGLEPMAALIDSLGLANRISGKSANLEEIRRMVIAGLGIGILPLMSVHNELAQGSLWKLEITNMPIGADVFLISNPATQLTIAERNFIDVIEELLPLNLL